MKQNLETQFPDVIPDEDEVYIRDKDGNFIRLEVPDDDADDQA